MPANVAGMELSQLASKQKRARDWLSFLEKGGSSNAGISTQIRALVVEFRALLSIAAQAGSSIAAQAGSSIAAQAGSSDAAQVGVVSPVLEAKIIDLERRLEQLNEEARLSDQG